MSEAVDKFCKVLGGLEDSDRSELVGFICLTLGAYPPLPADGNLQQAPDFSIDLLQGRMNKLVDEMHVKVEFLIPSIFQFLIDYHDRTNNPLAANSRMDGLLHMLDDIKAERAKPIGERENELTDDNLDNLKSAVEGQLSGMQEQIAKAEQTSDWLKEQWQNGFSDRYFERLAFKKFKR